MVFRQNCPRLNKYFNPQLSDKTNSEGTGLLLNVLVGRDVQQKVQRVHNLLVCSDYGEPCNQQQEHSG